MAENQPNTIARDKVKAMLMETPEDQHDALLARLKERGLRVVDTMAPPEAPTPEPESHYFGEEFGKLTSKAAQGLEKGADFAAEKMGAMGVPAPVSAALTVVPGTLGKAFSEPEAGAGSIGGPGTSLLGAMADDITPFAKAAGQKLTPTFMELGGKVAEGFKGLANVKIPLTAAEITETPAFAAIESMLSKIPFSSGAMERFQKIRASALGEYRSSLLEASGKSIETESLGEMTKEALAKTLQDQDDLRIQTLTALRDRVLKGKGESMAPTEAGQLLQSRIEALKEKTRKRASGYYKDAATNIPDELSLFDPRELREKAAEILKRKGGAPSTLPGSLESHLKEIIDGPQGLSWDKLHDMQSDYGAMSAAKKAANKGFQDVEGMIYGDLKVAAREAMERRAKEVGGDFLEKYNFAKSFYKDYRTTFDNDVVRKFLRTKPDQVFDSFVKRGSIEDLKQIKSIVGQQQLMPLRKALVEDVIGAEGAAVPSSAQIAKKLNDYKYKMNELLTPQQNAQIAKFAKTGELPQFVETELEKKLSSIAKRNPGQIVDTVMSGDPTISRAIKKMSKPEDWNFYKRRLVEKLIGESDAEMLSSKAMAKNLGKLDPEYRRLFVSDSELRDIEKIPQITRIMETGNRLWGNPSGTGRTIIAWEGGKLLLQNPVTGVVMALLPGIGAKFYLSEFGRRLLTQGINTTQAGAITNFARLSAFAANAQRETLKEDNKLK